MKQSGLKSIGVALAAMLATGSVVPAEGQRMSGIGESSVLSPLTEGNLARARAMASAGNYTGVADQLRLLQRKLLTAEEQEECDYLLVKALYETGNSTCVTKADEFSMRYPASERALSARLTAADYYYFNREFGLASERYRQIEINRLDSKSRGLYLFREGVSLLKSGLYDESRNIFGRLRDNKDYESRAEFYLAYIDYAEGKIDKAYDRFKSVEGNLPGNSEVSKRISRGEMRSKEPYDPTGYEAAYYMTQIDFRRGEYSKVIDNGYYLLNHRQVPELRTETERILGESYYKTGNQQSAKTYLEDYMLHCKEETLIPEATAYYVLGSVYYDLEDYKKASEMFSHLTDQRSAIGQGAWLYLGQIAVKEKNYSEAVIDFEKAYRMNFDNKVGETAMYNYIACRTRGSKLPFSSEIDLLENFLKSYPNSRYSNDVRTHLASAYFHEQDYSRAMQSIEQISRPTAAVLAAKQKVAYELGIENMSNGKASEAVKYMTIASTTGQNKEISLSSLLWLGDAYYAEGDYAKAQNNYEKFLNKAPDSANRTLCLYNLGYTLYMEQDYGKGARRFQEAINATPALPSPLQLDAVIRRADCLYYTGDTRMAMSSYSEAISSGATDSDYALLRRAMLSGINGDIEGKIADLVELARKFPESKWNATALLEKGLAYADLGQLSEAEAELRSVVKKYSSSPESRKALLNLAIMLLEKGDRGESVNAYREVISRWPGSEESNMAHDDLRKYYASTGELESYAAWLGTIPGAPRIKADDMEQLAFDAAERALLGDSEDTSRLEKYIRDYPTGSNLAQALIDVAEVKYGAGKYNEAFNYAERLLTSCPQSVQAPRALLLKGEILEKHFNSREHALETYRELERSGGVEFATDAYSGIMRTTSDATERLKYAQKVERSGGVSSESSLEASLYESLAYKSLGQTERSIKGLSDLAEYPSSEAGARAAVELAGIYLEKKDYKGAETVLTQFTEKGTPHHYWLARGFISLADACHGQGKTYLGIEYLNSLRDNYPGTEKDIQEMISSRLNAWKKK